MDEFGGRSPISLCFIAKFDTGLRILLRRLDCFGSNERRLGNFGPRDAGDTCFCKSGTYGFGDHIFDGLAAAKADLGLGRMDVDVDLFDREFEKQKRDRINAVRQY